MALEPPPFLTGTPLAIWRSTVAQLLASGATARVNPDALLAYVSAVASHQRATAVLSQTDIIVQRDGKAVPNPALQVQATAAATIARFSKQYGLTPMSAQTPIGGPPPKQPRWCDQHQRHECVHSRARGRGQCHGIAVLGLDACTKHAGVKVSESPAHVLAVEQRTNPIAGEPMDIGPAEALLWRVRVLSGEVARLDQVVSSLEADELVWGEVSAETTTSAEGTYSKRTEAARLNVWLTLREQRERALHAACEAALRANIEERLVRLAEQQGAVIHRLLLTVLGDFGISPDDPRMHEIIPMRLRELAAG